MKQNREKKRIVLNEENIKILLQLMRNEPHGAQKKKENPFINHRNRGNNDRTYNAGKHNQRVQDQQFKYKNEVEETVNYPIVTHKTADFHTQILISSGSGEREDIKLDPKSEYLKYIYKKLRESIEKSDNTEEILNKIIQISRSIFKSTKDIDTNQLKNPEDFKKNNVLALDEFIRQGRGVCRHHTLLNAYLLSRLKADGLIAGDIIHHRQSFTEPKPGAHTWNVFKDKKDGKVYSMGSLWNNVTCISEVKPGTLDQFYRGNSVENEIQEHVNARNPEQKDEKRIRKDEKQKKGIHYQNLQKDEHQEFYQKFLIHNNSPHLLNQNNPKAGFLNNNREKKQVNRNPNYKVLLKNLKKQIEETQFTVGQFGIFRGGKDIKIEGQAEKKRVPHRVAKIFNEIKDRDIEKLNDEEAKNLFQTVKGYAQTALDDKNPRKRDKRTTEFYQSITGSNSLENTIDFILNQL